MKPYHCIYTSKWSAYLQINVANMCIQIEAILAQYFSFAFPRMMDMGYIKNGNL